MLKNSTFRKYFLTISISFLLCLTVMVIILSFLLGNYLTDEKFKNLSKPAKSISEYSSLNYDSPLYIRNLKIIFKTVSDSKDETILITDSFGKVVICSCKQYFEYGNCFHFERGISVDYISGMGYNEFQEVGKLNGLLDDMHYTCVNTIINKENTVIGYVIVISPASELTELFKDLFKLYLFAASIPIIVLFFALYTLMYRWTKPLKLMSEASHSMIKGDFSKRIPVMSNDEIGQLANSFNQMTNSLVELEEMRRSFIANVSHELRTPMTTIGGFIDGILDGTITEDRHKYYLNIISKEVKRLSRLVEGMLSLSKLEAGKTQLNISSFDFRKLIVDVMISQMQRVEEKGIIVEGLDSIDDCIISADKDLIHQVVYNLCDNAIKFTDNKGTIKLFLEKDNDGFQFIIRNTGEGIKKEDLLKIFDRFYKVDSSRSANKNSTGLGLYLVKTIIKIHGGTTFARSNNSYTEFGIRMSYNTTSEGKQWITTI